MTTSTLAAREAARQPSGQFGTQYRPDATTTLVRPHCDGCGSTWDVVDGFCAACDLEEYEYWTCDGCGTTNGVYGGLCGACWDDDVDLW